MDIALQVDAVDAAARESTRAAQVPYTSLRGKGAYTIPESLYAEADAGRIVLLRTEIDWGPATKLIPTLSVETDPRTIIVTVDDDLDYPSTLIEHLYLSLIHI